MTASYHIEDDVSERAYDARLMKRLLRFVRPYRGMMLAATVLLLLAAVLSNLVPYLSMRAIDWAINNPERVAVQKATAATGAEQVRLQEQFDALAATDRGRLLLIVWALAVLTVCEMVLRVGQTVVVSFVGQKTMLEMRMDLFRHLQEMSLQFLDRNPVGRLMTRVTTDVEKIQQTIVTGLVQVVSDLFTIGVVLAFMLWVNWHLAAITLSTVPFVFLTSYIFRRYARRSYLEISRKIARLNAYMQETVSGMRVVQIFGREPRNYEQFRERNADHRDEWFRQIKYYAIYFPVVDFLGQLSTALIMLYVGYQLVGKAGVAGGTASVGMFLAYIQWADRLFGPIRALSDRYNTLLEAMASAERIFRLLDTPADIRDRPDAVMCVEPAGAVEFRDVSFAYTDGDWVLRRVNLSIAPGESVAIVGHTGAGKSTLIKLLSRFYDVQEGAVLVDGRDVREYDQTTLRRNIGVVLQDVFLFSGSVEDNIRLGDEAMTREHIEACAAHVNAARFIDHLPDGYAYDVGERGANLSTGQRQLIAFARALAHDPRILVLDEATSSVDTATEQLIQDAVIKLMAGRTSIVIAHRLSTIQHADRIIVMHHGEIREMGTHQELLAQRGLYYTLYQLQYKDQDIAA